MNSEDFLGFVQLCDNRHLAGLLTGFHFNSQGMQNLYSTII